MPRRAALLAVVAGAVMVASGCFNRPIGVDFSVDKDYRFDQIHRIAIVEPAGRTNITGLGGVLVDAAASSLSQRYHVYYGNGLTRLVDVAGVRADFDSLRSELLDGQDVDPPLMAKVAKAIGIDAFFFEEIANLDQHVESGPTYSTVEVNKESGYGTVTQNPSTTTVTTVRLGARLYDAATGLVVWSGSKIYSTAENVEFSGFTPIFTRVNKDFLLTIPVGGEMPAQGKAS